MFRSLTTDERVTVSRMQRQGRVPVLDVPVEELQVAFHRKGRKSAKSETPTYTVAFVSDFTGNLVRMGISKRNTTDAEFVNRGERIALIDALRSEPVRWLVRAQID